MMTVSQSGFASHSKAVVPGLSLDQLRQLAPAVFASEAHTRTSPKYTFIPTERILSGLVDAGFEPVAAQQVQSRSASPLHARHVLRLRRRVETIQLRDALPEIVFLNSHDGSSAYWLRMGLFRVVCTNGLIVSRGAFPAVCVAHRGNVVEAVVEGALQVAGQFEALAAQVERMEARTLTWDERLQFAGQAMAIRFSDFVAADMKPSQLLEVRRLADLPDSLWCTFNRVQENLLGGGLTRRGQAGRLNRSRATRSIRENVRINSRLWDLATQVISA